MSDLIEVEKISTNEMALKSDVMSQIEVARRYPRSLDQFFKKASGLVTFSQETAAQCFYALKRGGKTIEGPSIRLAEIVAASYGNLRCQASIVDVGDKFVTARGIAWDLENNTAISVDVQRRITGKDGRTYSDDMIGTTSNAGCSIALRNAIFKVVPGVMTTALYEAARKCAVGDAKSMTTRVDHLFKTFAAMGVTEEQVISKLGLPGRHDIGVTDLTLMLGVYNAIRDGDTSVAEQFNGGSARSSMAGAFTTEAPAE